MLDFLLAEFAVSQILFYADTGLQRLETSIFVGIYHLTILINST